MGHKLAGNMNAKKTINFGAGPAKLPEPVMAQIQAELLDYNGEGLGILEMSHRSGTFSTIIEKAEERLRRLIGVGPEYYVLFMQGGGTLQFAAVPLNLVQDKARPLHYIITGQWSKKAAEEARLLGFNAVELDIRGFPEGWKKALKEGTKEATYVYYCDNETVDGIEFPSSSYVANLLNIDPKRTCLISDMSSNFISRPIELEKFGLLFASAQKNVGPAGLTIVIVRKDLIQHAATLPKMLDYRVFAKEHSLYNTPPTFPIYVTELVLAWLEDCFEGSLERVDTFSREKANLIYNLIDQSGGRLINRIPVEFRSRMNVVWQMSDPADEARFFEAAKANRMVQLKGHRLVGGVRASLYNAITLEETRELSDLLKSLFF